VSCIDIDTRAVTNDTTEYVGRDACDAIKCDAVLCELTVIEDDANVEFRAPSLYRVRVVFCKIYDIHCACRDEFDYRRWCGFRMAREMRFLQKF
jgi:hypothetical protein